MLFGARRANGFGTGQFQVREIQRDQANALIRKHRSHTIVANNYVHRGVFIDGETLGVLQSGYAMNPSSGGAVVEGTTNDQYPELSRMWLDDDAPRLSERRAIAYAVRYTRRAWPSVKWLHSFANERCGLNGAVYQACNFVFVGEHLSTFWEVDGAFFHNVIMTAKGQGRGERGAWLRANADRAIRHELRQFRYLFFMAPRFRCGLQRAVQLFSKATRP